MMNGRKGAKAAKAGGLRVEAGRPSGWALGWFWPVGGVVALGALAGAPALAQKPLPTVSHEVVEPLPQGGESGQSPLNAALTRLGRNPRDIQALVDAARAALDLGDVSAATGFLVRADKLSPNNPQVLAWLGAARVRAQAPLEALPFFDAAERAGPIKGDPLTDRGLAYDMVGDNVSAQRAYRQAIATGADDEAARRLALSLAITGDRKGAEATLAPLLARQDRAAWRARAFAYAILGREDEAVAIAQSTMPADMATAISPYLRYMRRLTPAQQAAAANLGVFPRASQIGQDDPAIAQWAAAHGVKHLAFVEPAEEAPRPAAVAEPANGRRRRHEAEPVAPAPQRAQAAPVSEQLAARDNVPPEPTPTREAAAPVRSELAPAEEAAPRGNATPPEPAATPLAASAAPATMGPPRPAELAPATPPRATVSEPVVQPLPQPEPRAERLAEARPAPVRAAPRPSRPAPLPDDRHVSFAEAFSAWGKADSAVTPASGAVDIRKIKAPRPAPKAPPPPPPPVNPSRVWVQIGVGRQESRIAFDWHRLQRDEAKLLKGRKPYVSEWGRTNRLLLGPFEDEDAAKAYLEKLKKAGHDDAFVWLSPKGQAVDPLE